MSVKIGGIDLKDMKYNGDPVLAAKFNGVALWPTSLPVVSLYNRIIARSDTLTAAHFKTTNIATTTKYKSDPGDTVSAPVGELLAEYIKTGQSLLVPLPRALEIASSDRMRLRQYAGGGGTRKGVIVPAGAPTWRTYWTNLSSTSVNRIYFIDLTDEVWMALSSNDTGSGGIGGSYINWTLRNISATVRTSFSSRENIYPWLGAVRADTDPREFIVAIMQNATFTPAF